MERKGQVNQYSSRNEQHHFFTLNLADGVTPFIKYFAHIECFSRHYMLSKAPIITHVWYRPHREVFDKLDKGSQDHIFNGGLIFGKLNEVMTLHDDPIKHDVDYTLFITWANRYYKDK